MRASSNFTLEVVFTFKVIFISVVIFILEVIFSFEVVFILDIFFLSHAKNFEFQKLFMVFYMDRLPKNQKLIQGAKSSLIALIGPNFFMTKFSG